jgi:prepilin-type N-terminal cleavage/methylation domain-containing protein
VKRGSTTAGITLIEMIVVVAIIGLIGAVAFPAVTSGIDSARMSSASDSIVSFLNAALNRAERRQQPVEVVVSIKENKLMLYTVDTTRHLDMPESVRIVKVHPERLTEETEQERSIVLYPYGAIPRFGVEIASSRGHRRIVRVDPITGVPQVEHPQANSASER